MIKIYNFRVWNSIYIEDGCIFTTAFEKTSEVIQYLADCRRDGEIVKAIDCVCVNLTKEEKEAYDGEGFWNMNFNKMMDEHFTILFDRKENN